ncbi:hypothetical protein [Streptomyces filamentosus]|nr:hypothetical protein [Streptomyces filamentosus]
MKNQEIEEEVVTEQAAIWFPSGTGGITLLAVAVLVILAGVAMGRSRRGR